VADTAGSRPGRERSRRGLVSQQRAAPPIPLGITEHRIGKDTPLTLTAHRTYVLDTSVLLSSPRAMFCFGADDVVLPLVVIKELEAKRNDPELGGAARTALRGIENLRVTGGDLQKGVVVTAEGGSLRIETNHADRSHLPEVLRTDTSHDGRIIGVAAALAHEGADVVLVSKDLPMRILASAVVGLIAEDYRGDQLPDTGYSGVVQLDVAKGSIDTLYADRSVPLSDIDPDGTLLSDVPLHTGMILHANSSSALGTKADAERIELINTDVSAFGVRGRSAEQRIALAHLLNPDIGIVSLGGPGGTGKSLLALAAGLEAVIEKRTHKRIIVFRPLYAVGGQDLGFLPGTAEEKLTPWAAATFDALQAFCSEHVITEIVERNLIEVLPLTHIRGRTFTDTIVIIDEAQNLERNVLLTALSRTGENTRVFVTHDVAQRDNLRVGRFDGIAAVIERLKGEELFAHISLTRSERSAVAALVTRLLDQE
jgi:PhoH-like ATPase